jgi:lactoylglutathione lyase
LFESPKQEIDLRYFALKGYTDWIFNASIEVLKSNNVYFWNFINAKKERQMVFVKKSAVVLCFSNSNKHY